MKKNKYDEILQLTDELLERTNELLENVIELDQYVKKITKKYEKCNHIWFVSKFGHDEDEHNFSYEYTCTKCGLTKHSTDKLEGVYNCDGHTEYYIRAEQNPEYVTALYNDIIANNPGINDLGASSMLEDVITANKIANDEQGIARKLKINPKSINEYRGYGE